jgi:hypothetical protein
LLKQHLPQFGVIVYFSIIHYGIALQVVHGLSGSLAEIDYGKSAVPNNTEPSSLTMT